MSVRDIQRVEVLTEVTRGGLTAGTAAGVLGVSERQVWRLLRRYRDGGGGAILHRGRGRPSNNRLGEGVRELALELVRTRYRDFGPTLAAEMLAEKHGLEVSRETLRHWMADAGLWLSRRQRRQFHRPRLRREHLGELVQIDGSQHRWFEDRAGPCTLLVFIDDASGRLMQLRFVASTRQARASDQEPDGRKGRRYPRRYNEPPYRAKLDGPCRQAGRPPHAQDHQAHGQAQASARRFALPFRFVQARAAPLGANPPGYVMPSPSSPPPSFPRRESREAPSGNLNGESPSGLGGMNPCAHYPAIFQASISPVNMACNALP